MKPAETRPEAEIGAWSPHEASLTELWPEVRGPLDARLRLRGEEAWDWAFRRNPAGTRLQLARRGGRVVAAFGALPTRVRAFNEPRVFAHALPAFLQAGEPEASVIAAARALYAGHLGAQKDLIHYGWPGGSERRFVEGALEQELVRVESLLELELGPGPDSLPRGIQEIARFPAEVETLYVRCAAGWGASTVRDAAFLNWRFVDHPLLAYRILALAGESVPRGIAVYRAPELGGPQALLVDWLVTPGDEAAGRALAEAAAALARVDGARTLALHLPEWSPWSVFLQERGFRHRPTEELLFVKSALPRLDMLWLRDHWWSTLADVLTL